MLNNTIECFNSINLANSNENILKNDQININLNESDLLNNTQLIDDKSLSFLALNDSNFATKNNILLDLIENEEKNLVCCF